jgi:type III secretory pathway component EscR
MTNYTPSCELNISIQNANNLNNGSLSNGNEYRKFMQQNGEELMIKFAEEAYKQTLQENEMLARSN